jgi:hypothetical protein
VDKSSSFITHCIQNNDDNKDGMEERLEDLEIYRLDYEEPKHHLNDDDDDATEDEETKRVARAAGGEILEPGDHVYMWCTLYQHHGIVLETSSSSTRSASKNSTSSSSPTSSDTSDADDDRPFLLIAEFTNVALAQQEGNEQQGGSIMNTMFTSASIASDASVGDGVLGGFRFVPEETPEKWHKVKYRANPLECLSWRPGTCSAAVPCDVNTILMRVCFMRDRRWDVLPDYHVLASNCETVAVWCVTGKWETLQADRAMQVVSGAATVVAYTTPVGFVAVAGVLWHSWQLSRRKGDTSNALNRAFDWYAMGKTPSEFSFFVLKEDGRW